MQRFIQFPPFYTLQPNQDTRVKQIELWIDYILTYCLNQKQFIINPSCTILPFKNEAIGRALPNDAIDVIFNQMLILEKAVKGPFGYFILWHSLDKWAEIIKTWVFDTGKNGSILTMYELIHDCPDQEFYQIDERLMTMVLQRLEKKGGCALFNSQDGNTGVKFS